MPSQLFNKEDRLSMQLFYIIQNFWRFIIIDIVDLILQQKTKSHWQIVLELPGLFIVIHILMEYHEYTQKSLKVITFFTPTTKMIPYPLNQFEN